MGGEEEGGGEESRRGGKRLKEGAAAVRAGLKMPLKQRHQVSSQYSS